MSYSTNYPPPEPVATIFPLELLTGQRPGMRLAAHAEEEEPPLDLNVKIVPEKTSNKDVSTAYYLFTAFNIIVALYHIVRFILTGSI